MVEEKVSIIIPVYNSEKTLKKCIESVINQTYKNIEILIINDGSKDKSLNIMNEYKNKDKRIIVINQRNNGITSHEGTDNNQYFYEMECLNCGHKYYANGTDIWQRKCPACQGGRS